MYHRFTDTNTDRNTNKNTDIQTLSDLISQVEPYIVGVDREPGRQAVAEASAGFVAPL